MHRILTLVVVAVLGSVAAGCGGSDTGGVNEDALVVYSGRAEKLVGPLLEQFERDTGVELSVRYGDSAELAATISEEGDNSPADVFFAQDAGALGAVSKAGMLKRLPQATLAEVPERFRSPDSTWVGLSGRARVVAYSTERVKRSELPDSIFDFTDPKWKGRIGFPPPNASFQAFISAMRLTVGDARTRQWLADIKANDPTLLENNIQTEEAIAAGEIDVGFVNHYYLYELRAEHGEDFAVANHFLKDGDPGSLVNVAGAGILRTTDRAAQAKRLVDYLLSRRGQRFFRDKTFEYPLSAGLKPLPGLPKLADIHGPDIALGDLGEKLPSTLEMLQEAGFSS